MSVSMKTIKKKVPSNKSVFRKQENHKNGNKQSSSAQDILSLHQTIGNQGVQRLFESGFIQGKLTVGEPNDKYEQEADRVADEVMRMPEPSVQRQSEEEEEKEETVQAKPIGERITPLVQRQAEPEEEKEENEIQAKAERATPKITPTLESRINALRGGGQPLSQETRGFFEPRFGQDFSGVRVHIDSNANYLARSINAKAFTRGNDVVFGGGEYSPENSSGKRLLGHELTHVVQQAGAKSSPDPSIQCKNGDDDNPGSTSKDTPLRPRAGSKQVWFQGVQLSDDTEFMRGELQRLIAREGLKGADLWYGVLTGSRSTINLPFSAHARAYGGLRVRTPIDAMREVPPELKQRRLARIRPLVIKLYPDVRSKAIKFIKLFDKKAKKNLLTVLEAHETQAKAEGIRYGITSKTIKKILYHKEPMGGMYEEISYETQYNMDRNSFATKGLQGAAKVLLQRRQAIDKEQKEQSKHVKSVPVPYEPKARMLVPTAQYKTIGKKITEKKKEYNQLRDYLSVQYPALAAFSDLNKGVGGLKQIAEKGAGPDTAALIGEKIAEKIAKIEKVRSGLKSGEVNVWRLSKIVNVTAVQMGATTDRMKARLVKDNREAEQPGILDGIALLVLNIGAIILAPATGGASLAVAAGVNIVVAGVHAQEYLMKEALTGTTFHKAQAISQDEPSLFWLAFEIVGAVVDVGAAAAALVKTFRTLAPLTKAALAAKGGDDAAKAIKALRVAAGDVKGGKSLIERVVVRIRALRSGESRGAAALKAVGATDKEVKLLGKAGMAAEKAAAKRIGKVAKGISGDVNVSTSGHIFVCTNPCTILRDKYAQIFAKSDEMSQGFKRELVLLEGEAQKAAEMRAAGKIAKAKEAEALADSVKQRVLALERRIGQANPQFLSVDELEKLLRRPDFAKETIKGKELRFVRYQKGGGKLPFPEWQRRAEQIWKNSSKGTLTEKELQEAMDLGLKNYVSMADKTGAKSFIPDHIVGSPDQLEWGKPYHFIEIKNWQYMSDTGNLKAMLDYVENTSGSKITLYYRSNAKMSGPLIDKIEKLRKIGKAELLPYAGR